MEFALPKELAYKLNISQKTVYNYLTKYTDKIRTKKDFWKKYVHIEDFTKVFQTIYNPVRSPNQVSPEQSNWWEFWKDAETTKPLSLDFDNIISKNESLEKQNNNLQEQVTKYALLLREEKTEKNLFMERYDDLQKTYTERLEDYSKERIRRHWRYSALLVITWVSALIGLLAITLYLIASNVI